MSTAMQSYDIQHDIKSQNVNELGMRAMQARVWAKRNSKNLLWAKHRIGITTEIRPGHTQNVGALVIQKFGDHVAQPIVASHG